MEERSRWLSGLSGFLAIGLSVLPNLACPACWPAYAAVLSSLGLGFLMDTAYLFPLTVAFLGTALLGLAFRSQRRRGLGPFALGLFSSIALVVGKFILNSAPVLYAGIILLGAASFWNLWPVKAAAACSACVPEAAKD